MEHIVHRNQVKTWLYMAALTTLLGLLGTFLSAHFGWGLSGTGYFLILSGIINLGTYYFGDRLILSAGGAKAVSPEQAPEYYAIMEDLARKAGMPMPKLYVVHVDEMNAFATGRNPEHAAVAATRGLLEKLTKSEVRAVLAHELSHVKNYDTRILAVVSIIAGLVSLLADMYWRSRVFSQVNQRDSSGVSTWIGVALSVFAPITATLIQLSISRRRELIADATGAKLCGHAEDLISALKKISLDRRPLPHTSPATAHLYFSNPFEVDGFFDRVFSTHPPLAERIAQLELLK